MSNMCKNGHKKDNGKKNPVTRKTKEDRSTTKKDIKITGVVNIILTTPVIFISFFVVLRSSFVFLVTGFFLPFSFLLHDGAPNWTRQHICPAKSVECRKCKKRGHYEKMCRIPKRIQYVDKTTSSAEKDNWGYGKNQKINNNKKENDYIYVTLLVNNAPIKFIIDSGSLVTLIPQR